MSASYLAGVNKAPKGNSDSNPSLVDLIQCAEDLLIAVQGPLCLIDFFHCLYGKSKHNQMASEIKESCESEQKRI